MRDWIIAAAHLTRVLYFSAFTAHPVCNLDIRNMPIQVQSLLSVTKLSDYPRSQVLDANLGQGNYCASENGLIVTSFFAAG